MSFATFVSNYGYLALAIGCLLEGETIVLLAGLAVHRGMMAGPWVMLIASICSFLGDQFWFQIGHRYGQRLFERFPRLARQRTFLEKHLFAHPDALVLALRFMVGLRTAGPILLGAGFLAPRRFFWLNLAGALLWAGIFISLGYFFGELAERLLPKIKTAEEDLFLLLFGGIILFQLINHLRKRRHDS